MIGIRSVRELESGRDVSYAYGYEQGGRVVTELLSNVVDEKIL